MKIELLYEVVGVPKDEQGREAELKDYQVSTAAKLVMLKDKEIRTLGLLGESQLGKTFLVCQAIQKIVQVFYKKNNLDVIILDSDVVKQIKRKVQYMTFFELELKLRTAQTKGTMEELYKELTQTEYLFVDEIGRGKWSDFTATFFENVIIKRYGEQLQTCFVSNLTIDEFKGMFDLAILKRLEQGSVMILEKN